MIIEIFQPILGQILLSCAVQVVYFNLIDEAGRLLNNAWHAGTRTSTDCDPMESRLFNYMRLGLGLTTSLNHQVKCHPCHQDVRTYSSTQSLTSCGVFVESSQLSRLSPKKSTMNSATLSLAPKKLKPTTTKTCPTSKAACPSKNWPTGAASRCASAHYAALA